MKLVILVSEFFSPSLTFIIRKVKSLAEQGVSVTVVSFGSPQSRSHEEILQDVRHVQVIHSPPDTGSFLKRVCVSMGLLLRALLRSPRDLSLFWGLTRRYESWRSRIKHMRKLLGLVGVRGDVYHFEFGDLAASYIEYLKGYAKPCVVSFRGADADIYPLAKPQLHLLYREVMENADRVHCVSGAVANQVSQWGGAHKIFINRPSIDDSFFVPGNLMRDPNLVLSVSRLKWKKGLTYALLAIAKLVPSFPSLRYVIVGEGACEDELRFYAADLGIQDHVEFHGRASAADVRNLLGQAAVYLLASVEEGISNSVLEAMAMEVPVVTTDAGGMAEVLTNGVEGFVVPRYNPDALAEKIHILLADEGQRQQMGSAGRQTILREFTIERQVQTFLREYHSLYRK